MFPWFSLGSLGLNGFTLGRATREDLLRSIRADP